jgi:hypothetical protein
MREILGSRLPSKLTQVVKEGHPVGVLLAQKGYVARARVLYQRVIDSPHPTASAIAVRRLVSLNRRTGFGQARRRRPNASGPDRR